MLNLQVAQSGIALNSVEACSMPYAVGGASIVGAVHDPAQVPNAIHFLPWFVTKKETDPRVAKSAQAKQHTLHLQRKHSKQKYFWPRIASLSVSIHIKQRVSLQNTPTLRRQSWQDWIVLEKAPHITHVFHSIPLSKDHMVSSTPWQRPLCLLCFTISQIQVDVDMADLMQGAGR